MGRVVVPKQVRDALGLVPGSTVDISLYGAGQTSSWYRFLPHSARRGAVYDAPARLAARVHSVPLSTRDARALGTYAAVGAEIELVGS